MLPWDNADAGVCDERLTGDQVVHLRRHEWVVRGGGPPIAVEVSQPVSGVARPPVLLLHGFAQNRFTWRVQGRSFVAALVEAGHPVLNVELRGHGRSRALGAMNAACFADYVDDVVRVVGACAGVAPFVVGHSLGAAVALGAATECDVRGVVHLAGIYRFASTNPVLRAIARGSLGLSPWLTRGTIRVSTGWAGDLLARAYQLTDIAGHGLPLAGWTPGSIEREVLEDRLVRGFDWTSVEVWLEVCGWACGVPFPYAEPFSALEVPLLVMVGDSDALARPADARPCFDDSRSSDKSWMLMDAFHHQTHWGHVDLILGRLAPVEVWPRLVQWLGARS